MFIFRSITFFSLSIFFFYLSPVWVLSAPLTFKNAHTSPVHSVAIHTNDNFCLIASADHEGTVKIWNQDGQLTRVIQNAYPLEKGLAFDQAGAALFMVERTETHRRLKVVSLASAAAPATLSLGPFGVAPAFASAADVFVYVVANKLLRVVYDPATHTFPETRGIGETGEISPVHRLALSADGNLAAFTLEDGSMFLRHADGSNHKIPDGNTHFIDVAFYGNHQLAASTRNSLVVWNNIKQPNQRLETESDERDPIVLLQGRTLVAASAKQEPETLLQYYGFVDASKGKLIDDGLGVFTALAADSEGKLLAAGHRDGSVRFWRADYEKQPEPLRKPSWVVENLVKPTTTLCYFPNFLVLGHENGFQVWNPSNRLMNHVTTFAPTNFLAATEDGILSIHPGEETGVGYDWKLNQHTGQVTSNERFKRPVLFQNQNKQIPFAAHGRFIAYVRKDGSNGPKLTLKDGRNESYEENQVMITPKALVLIQPHYELAVAYGTHRVRVLTRNEGKLKTKRSVKTHFPVEHLLAHPQESIILARDVAGNAALINPTNGSVTGLPEPVQAAAFHPKTLQIVVITSHHRVLLYDFTRDSAELTPSATLNVGFNPTLVAYSPSGNQLAFADKQGGIVAWNIQQNKPDYYAQGFRDGRYVFYLDSGHFYDAGNAAAKMTYAIDGKEWVSLDQIRGQLFLGGTGAIQDNALAKPSTIHPKTLKVIQKEQPRKEGDLIKMAMQMLQYGQKPTQVLIVSNGICSKKNIENITGGLETGWSFRLEIDLRVPHWNHEVLVQTMNNENVLLSDMVEIPLDDYGLKSITKSRPTKTIPSKYKHALLVSIQNYQTLDKLSKTHEDADLMVDFFESYASGSYKWNTVRLKDEQAKNMVSKLEEMLQKNNTEKDLIVVYFSGHGFVDKTSSIDNHVRLALINFQVGMKRKALRENSISLIQLRNIIAKSPSKARVVLILDACHSGAFGVTREGIKGNFDIKDTLIKAIGEQSFHAVLSSSTINQLSREWDKLGAGLFTYFLHKGLLGSANNLKDTDSARLDTVDLYELFAFMDKQMKKFQIDRSISPIQIPTVSPEKRETLRKIKLGVSPTAN